MDNIFGNNLNYILKSEYDLNDETIIINVNHYGEKKRIRIYYDHDFAMLDINKNSDIITIELYDLIGPRQSKYNNNLKVSQKNTRYLEIDKSTIYDILKGDSLEMQ